MNTSYAMNAVSKLAPSATKMIRADHTKVVATFHRYQLDASLGLPFPEIFNPPSATTGDAP